LPLLPEVGFPLFVEQPVQMAVFEGGEPGGENGGSVLEEVDDESVQARGGVQDAPDPGFVLPREPYREIRDRIANEISFSRFWYSPTLRLRK